MLRFDLAFAAKALATPPAATVARCDQVLSTLSRMRPMPSDLTDSWLDKRLEAMGRPLT